MLLSTRLAVTSIEMNVKKNTTKIDEPKQIHLACDECHKIFYSNGISKKEVESLRLT